MESIDFELPSQIKASGGERGRDRSESRSPDRTYRKRRSASRDRRNEYSEGSRSRQRYRSRSPRSSKQFSERAQRGSISPRPPQRARTRELCSRSPTRSNNRRSNPSRENLPGLSEPSIHPSGGDGEENPKKEKPNFGLSGLLVAETNTYNGVVVKYNEPAEAIKPQTKWRWYCFKGEEQIDMLQLYRQSAYLIGRDRKVADIPLDHASISKQHAVLQYRKVIEKDQNDGKQKTLIKPYLIDLETPNGTYVNGTRIPASRYFELKHTDVLKFAFSTREYVFMREE